MKQLFFLILYIFFQALMLFADDYVNIFISDWHILRRARLSEEMIRDRPDDYIKITDISEIQELQKILKSPKLKKDNLPVKNIQIIIDFIQNDKIIETYIINKYNFYLKGTCIRYKTPESIVLKYFL